MSQPRNGKYLARWRTPYGQSRSRSFPSKLAADRYERQMKADIDAGRYIDPNAGNILLAEYATGWLAGKHNLADSTRRQYKGSIDGHIIPALGKTAVNKVTPSDVREFVAQLVNNGTSPARVQSILAPLKQVFDQAIEDQMIVRNPAKKVPVPQGEDREMVIASPDEIDTLDAAAGDHHGIVVTFLAYTGLRWGEMAALDVADVDLLRGEVRVRKALNEKMVVGPTKTRKSRTVPLEAVLLERLRDHIVGKKPSDPLFCGKQGGRLMASNWRRKVWAPAKAKAGVDPAMRVHDLRHTAATWLVQLTDIKTAMEILGHTNIATTARYIHTSPERMRDAVRRLGELRQVPMDGSTGTVVEL